MNKSDQQAFSDIQKKIIDPDNIKKMMPMIEEHIDHFLKVKLAKEMPMIGMFIGDKTITQLKTVFMAELEELFPVVMKNYMKSLQNELSADSEN